MVPLHHHTQSSEYPLTLLTISSNGLQDGVGDDNDIFKIKVIYGHQDDDKITPIYSVFQLIHVNEQCSLECRGKQLPKWLVLKLRNIANVESKYHSKC